MLAVAAILWSVVDERVTMAFGLAFFYVVVTRAMVDPLMLVDPQMGGWSNWRWTLIDMGILAILPVLTVAVGATVAARRARI